MDKYANNLKAHAKVVMKEILVAVDGSKQSDEIVGFASVLAKAMLARVVVAYVIPLPSIPDEYRKLRGKGRMSTEESENKVIAERIVSDMEEILNEKGVQHAGVCERGHPPSKILEIAESRKVDLIVMGVIGYHGLGGQTHALGSVSRRVIEGSSIPVVLVP